MVTQTLPHANAKVRRTVSEVMALPESMLPQELIDGELVIAGGPSLAHQQTLGDLYLWLRRHIPHGIVYIAPTDVYFDEHHLVQPDLLWIAAESDCTPVEGKYFKGAPTLIVEIISPSSVQRDRKTKYELYERYGVREYWLVESEAHLLEIYHLVEGRYQRVGAFTHGDSALSPLLGNLAIEAIFPPMSAE